MNWDDGKNRFGLYSTAFNSGETSQRTGGFSYGNGDFEFRYENDFVEIPLYGVGKVLADGYDRYRTTGASVRYRDFSLNLRMFTGDPTKDPGGINVGNEYYPGASPTGGPNGSYQGTNANNYRLGFMSIGYKGYQLGRNSESIRNFWQNTVIHDNIGVPRFPIVGNGRGQTIFQYQSSNPYTLW